MASTLHVRSVDVCSAPAFGAQTNLNYPVPRQAATAQLSRDAYGRWNGTPSAFGLRTTPVLDARGEADSLRVSQTVDVITLLLAAAEGGQLLVLPTAMIVPAGVHTARFVKVNPNGLPQVVSPWFAVRVPLDTHDVHAPVQAGALAASLALGAYAQCIVLLALPIAAQVSSIASDGRPVLTPLHPITGAPGATLAFAVADHALSFANTPLVLRHAATECFGTLERVVAAAGAVDEDARAVFVQTHGPDLSVALGDVVELVRYRDAMVFETYAGDDDAPIEIAYEYERTITLTSALATHVFTDIARNDGPAVVYNVYCAHPYELSADGVTWSPVVRDAHTATRVRAPLHVRLVDIPASNAAFRAQLTLARYVLGADPTTMHLVYEHAQTVGVSTFGDAPITGEKAAVGPFTLFADAYARNALEVVPTGAFLHSDRSIIAPTPLRGACLYVAEARASRLAPYTGTHPRFESRTTIGGLTLGSGTQDMLFQTPEMRMSAPEGRVQGLRVTGALIGGGASVDVPIVAIVAPPATPAAPPYVPVVAPVTVAPPASIPYSMVPFVWAPEMTMLAAAPGATVTVRLETVGGVYYFAGTTSPANPTLYALGATLIIEVVAGAAIAVHLDDTLQTLPLTVVRTTRLTYNQGQGTIFALQNVRIALS